MRDKRKAAKKMKSLTEREKKTRTHCCSLFGWLPYQTIEPRGRVRARNSWFFFAPPLPGKSLISIESFYWPAHGQNVKLCHDRILDFIGFWWPGSTIEWAERVGDGQGNWGKTRNCFIFAAKLASHISFLSSMNLWIPSFFQASSFNQVGFFHGLKKERETRDQKCPKISRRKHRQTRTWRGSELRWSSLHSCERRCSF